MKQKTQFWYTSTGCFDSSAGDGWISYKEWIQLPQLIEVVSLDGMLNTDLNTENSVYIPECAIIENNFITQFYSSLDYVISHTPPGTKFNLLAVIKNPAEDCSKMIVDNFELIGYDLLDTGYDNSALTNCGGYYDVYSPNDINQYGLISDYSLAVDICKRLRDENPGDNHADTNIFAVWRHKFLGQTQLIDNIKSAYHDILLSLTGFDEPNNGRSLYICKLYIKGEDVTTKYFGEWNRLNPNLNRFLFDSPDGKYIFVPAENGGFFINTNTYEKIPLPYKSLTSLTFVGNMFSENNAYIIYNNEVVLCDLHERKIKNFKISEDLVTDIEIGSKGNLRIHLFNKNSGEHRIKKIRH